MIPIGKCIPWSVSRVGGAKRHWGCCVRRLHLQASCGWRQRRSFRRSRGVEFAYWQKQRRDALHKCKRHLGSNLPIGKSNEAMLCINARDIWGRSFPKRSRGVELAYWQIKRRDALHICKRHVGSNLPIGKSNEEMLCINARDILGQTI